MTIKTIENTEIKDICSIHKMSFDKTHFTSVLPEKLLEEYYRSIIEFCNYKVIIYDNESNSPIGFAIGSRDISGFLSSFIRNNFFNLLITIFKNPRFLVEKTVSLLSSIFSKKSISSKADVMLFVIAVNPLIKIHGKGKLVLNEFENILISNSVYQYSIMVRKNNEKAIKFYEKNGFKIEFTTNESFSYIKFLEYVQH